MNTEEQETKEHIRLWSVIDDFIATGSWERLDPDVAGLIQGNLRGFFGYLINRGLIKTDNNK